MDLISTYADDDDDEDDQDKQDKEVNNKRELELDEDDRSNKRIRYTNNTDNDDDLHDLPDLPEELFSSSDQQQSAERSQNGKKRQYEHVEGNYPTFVFVTIPIEREDIDLMARELSVLAKELKIDTAIENHHISLSRSFPMREHHIDSFNKQLETCFKRIHAFSITLETVSTFVNDDQSRLFLAANVTKNASRMIQCVKQLDDILRGFGFPTFYDNPLPHLSLWSRASSPDDELCKKPIINRTLEQTTKSILIDKIYWTIGKYDYSIDLATI
ncbi:hypothetical protein SAMD00019534_052270 [Acytostelium subglobosum LB1]|uniref:hypothetical protein n=1 Tax=Acytostelium subglobosum LB1 TaxID=1410327 RepID=UPI000644C840|nr:hypothetical protein SAMD00019534_052270 [Acytostelium subglobosum LB1]GAM22052.1 hypothetical protein SAMD00019534_052270 [Acytostelium subglobosum LB1]|eukprot:XP_012755152.1 hypothetical protein SAMD00019534_052270 [Acytostelium subglobosum LB1]